MAFFYWQKKTKNVVLCWNVTQLNKHDKYSKKISNRVKEKKQRHTHTHELYLKKTKAQLQTYILMERKKK